MLDTIFLVLLFIGSMLLRLFIEVCDKQVEDRKE